MLPSFTYLPYVYFLKTRLTGNFQRVSWLFVYFIPIIFLYSRIASLKNVYDYSLLILGFLIINYVYENGYLENDVQTIKKEEKPTLRLSEEEIRIVDNSFTTIFFIRGVILILMLAGYFICAKYTTTIVMPFTLLFAALLLQILYLIYNRIRNIVNLYLIIPLSFIRFFGFILPFVETKDMGWFVLLATLLYPLSKFIEFAQKKRFKTIISKGDTFNVDRFRVKYYLLLTLLLIGFRFLFRHVYILCFMEASIFFLLYRIAGLAIISNKKVVGDFKNNFGRSGEKH